MTDARLPGRWLTDPEFLDLNDRLWRVHTSALMWSAEQGTDGAIPRRVLRLLHPDGATIEDARALVASGLWSSRDDDYAVTEWAPVQSLAADVERGRAQGRERQAKHRAKARARVAENDVASSSPFPQPVLASASPSLSDSRVTSCVTSRVTEEQVNKATGEVIDTCPTHGKPVDANGECYACVIESEEPF